MRSKTVQIYPWFFLRGCERLSYHSFFNTSFKCQFNVPNTVGVNSGHKIFKELPAYESDGYYENEFPFLTSGSIICEYYGKDATVDIPSGFTNIGSYAFDRFDGDRIRVPSTCRYLADWAFKDSDFETLEMEGSITYIGNYCFRSARIDSLTFKEGLEVIQHDAFARANINDIYLPGGLRAIGTDAFDGLGEGCTIHCSDEEVMELVESHLSGSFDPRVVCDHWDGN